VPVSPLRREKRPRLAEDEAISHQVLFNCGSSLHARVVWRYQAHERQEQQARIELAPAIRLGERIQIRAEVMTADVVAYPRAWVCSGVR
jgi:hypothetical protein